MELTVQLQLGTDDEAFEHRLEVIRMRGEERIGAPYRFELEVVTDHDTDLPDELLAGPATLRFIVDEATRRTIRGAVVRLERELATGSVDYRIHRLEIIPLFGELARFSSQDVYVGKTYPDVIRDKLELAGFEKDKNLSMRLLDPEVYGKTPWKDGDPVTELAQPRLVVQYRESDLDFVSRLAEHVGLAYYFEDGLDDDDEAAELLVFTDHAAGYKKLEQPVVFGGSGTEHSLVSLRRVVTAVPSAFYAYDYSYRTPRKTYERGGERVFDAIGGEAHLEQGSPGALVEYAPNAKTEAEAALIAKVRADAREGERERFHARGPVPALYPGLRFELSGHPEIDDDVELLVIAATHSFEGASSFAGVGAKRARYDVELELVRAEKLGPDQRKIPFRPALRTPRPRIHGVVTGTVQSVAAGQAEGHQHIDAEGRYLVKLHFDQTPVVMPRMRMAQPHVGEGYGHHFPLRPGAEVIVAFLDGDPDRPVIVGAVPNPLKRSPVVAPKSGEDVEVSRIQTRSGMRIEFSDGTVSSSRDRSPINKV